MNTKFKKLLGAVVALVLGIGAETAQSQYGLLKTIAGGSTYNIVAGMATNITTAVTVTKFDEVALQISFKSVNASCTTNIGILWATSVDGTNYTTLKQNESRSWFSMTPDGTAVVCMTTNLPVKSFGYWKLLYITNVNNTADTEYLTNVTIKVWGKPKRFGG